MIRLHLKNFIRRLFARFLSESTYNTMAYYIFYFGYITRLCPIERPILKKLGNLGQVVIVHHRPSPYQRFLRGVAIVGLIQYVSFQILQMVRFVPTEGFTLRVVYVIYYFALQLLAAMAAYVTFKYEHLFPLGWNCVEATTKLCQRYGIRGAAKWKYSPMVSIISVPLTLGVTTLASGMILLFAVKPNLPAHIFYLLPEAWKTSTIAYLALLIWQTFLFSTGASAINYLSIIAIAFIFGTKIVAVETAASGELSIPGKIRIFRAVEMANQIANQIGQNVLFPVLSFFTVATGVTFSYIALTRYGDPHLGLPVYCAVVFVDILTLLTITICYVQIGKYSDASKELIESIRTAMKEKEVMKRRDLLYLRKKIATLRPFGLSVGSVAELNVETVKLLHETIIDYLMLLLEL